VSNSHLYEQDFFAWAIAAAYRLARIAAARETGLDRDSFAPQCPWSFEQVIADDFWPGGEA
jgi:hypothetical protein